MIKDRLERKDIKDLVISSTPFEDIGGEKVMKSIIDCLLFLSQTDVLLS